MIAVYKLFKQRLLL